MTQDTRKDKRAKVVSLNVRYKSATVDEFIDNHSHDVSRGGLFVKTQSPFASGTLLKFEIRIATDQPVISGVGRVVWKREADQASADRPSGMGVKFIKIDEPSRQLIERLLASKADAGSAYESESERPITLPGIPAAQPVSLGGSYPAPVSVPAPRMPGPGAKTLPDPRPLAGATPAPPRATGAAPRPGAAAARKQTIMGLGQPSVPPPGEARGASGPPAGGSMFDAARAAAPAPAPGETPNEPTVMKQAAELLEEALKEVGSGLDEEPTTEGPSLRDAVLGSAPPPAVHASQPVTAPPPSGRARSGDTVPLGSTDRPAWPVTPGSAPPNALAPTVPGMAAPQIAAPSSPPVAPAYASGAAPRLAEQVEEPRRSSGVTLFAVLAVLVAAAGGGLYAFRDKLNASDVPAPTAEPPPETPPSAAAADAGEPPADAASPDAGAVADASAAALATALDAGKADAAPVDAGKAPAPAVAPRPAPARPRPPTPTPAATPSGSSSGDEPSGESSSGGSSSSGSSSGGSSSGESSSTSSGGGSTSSGSSSGGSTSGGSTSSTSSSSGGGGSTSSSSSSSSSSSGESTDSTE